MKIGLVDVDRTGFPNLALMKIARFHRGSGDVVEWANPLFCNYDRVYMSKIFNFSPPNTTQWNCEVVKGGTGYDLRSTLPEEIDSAEPDYSIYPNIPTDVAYGFLTRGCPNKCPWCVVPIKEGAVRPYRDVEQIATSGRRKLILMDNNILASDYGLDQIAKIVEKGYRVDFNQAMDARLVTEDIAKLLSRVKWLTQIRFGCDTPAQVAHCERAMHLIDKYRGRPASYLLYTMIGEDINEAYIRLSYFRENRRVRIVAQPYRDYNNPRQAIPQWQRDMARWAMRREIYATCDFAEYRPRKNFFCKNYFDL